MCHAKAYSLFLLVKDELCACLQIAKVEQEAWEGVDIIDYAYRKVLLFREKPQHPHEGKNELK